MDLNLGPIAMRLHREPAGRLSDGPDWLIAVLGVSMPEYTKNCVLPGLSRQRDGSDEKRKD